MFVLAQRDSCVKKSSLRWKAIMALLLSNSYINEQGTTDKSVNGIVKVKDIFLFLSLFH